MTDRHFEKLYFVAYDIADPKRWRAIYKTMHGYGDWVQLSLFQCRLTDVRHAELIADLDTLIHHKEDHIVIVDLGSVERVKPKVISLGKHSYKTVETTPVVV